MAVKSVVDIEVNDASFKDFVALFNKYNTALGKMPGVWNSTTDSIQTTGKKTDSLTAAVEALSKILGKQITEQSKMRKEIDNGLETSAIGAVIGAGWVVVVTSGITQDEIEE